MNIPSSPLRQICMAVLYWFAAVLVASGNDPAPGDIDLSFNPGSAIGDYVLAAAAQSDGKWIIAGMDGVKRLNVDGSLDTSFLAGPIDGRVTNLAVQPDDGIIIVGSFGEIAGEVRNKIARLLPDGRLDPDFGDGLSGV